MWWKTSSRPSLAGLYRRRDPHLLPSPIDRPVGCYQANRFSCSVSGGRGFPARPHSLPAGASAPRDDEVQSPWPPPTTRRSRGQLSLRALCRPTARAVGVAPTRRRIRCPAPWALGSARRAPRGSEWTPLEAAATATAVATLLVGWQLASSVAEGRATRGVGVSADAGASPVAWQGPGSPARHGQRDQWAAGRR